MNIPKLVYKSLDVGIPYFSTIKNFVIDMALGHVVTLPLGQVLTLFSTVCLSVCFCVLMITTLNVQIC